MKAMILSAGLGTRMRPLTDHTPKPLLKAGGQYLISYHLQKLRDAGIRDIVINTHWLSEQLITALGSGEQWKVRIHYSHEPVLLETAGGIAQALPHLVDGADPFILVNGDIYTDLDFRAWLAQQLPLPNDILASLVLVPNPEHHPEGDFCLENGLIKEKAGNPGQPSLTYSGIGLFHPDFFAGVPAQPMKLAPLLHQFVAQGKVIGIESKDYWLDVGTPERLGELNERIRKTLCTTMPVQQQILSIADQIHAAKLGFQGPNGEFEPCRISLTPYRVTPEQWDDALATARALNQLHLALSHNPEILRDMIAPLHGGGTLLDAFLPYLVPTNAAAVNLCRHDFLLDQKGVWRLVESNAIAAGMGPFSEKCSAIQRDYPSNHSLEFTDNPAIATQSTTLFDAAKKNRQADQPLIVFVVEANENNVFDQRYLADALRDKGAEVLFLTLSELHQQLTSQGNFLALPDGRLVDLFYFRSGYNLLDYQIAGVDLIAFRARLEQHRVALCPSIAAQVASSKWVQKELSSRLQAPEMEPWMAEFGLDHTGYLLAQAALEVEYRDIEDQNEPENAADWLVKNQNEGGGNVQEYHHELAELARAKRSLQQGWFLMKKIPCQASTSRKDVFSAGSILSLTDTITEVGIFSAGDDAHYAGYLARSKARTSLETGVHSGQGMVDAIAFDAGGAFDA